MGCRGREPTLVGRRGGFLTRGRAPQDGFTPLYVAAHLGHLEQVQALEKAGADKDAPANVREGRGGHVERTNGVCVCVCVSCWGLQQDC